VFYTDDHLSEIQGIKHGWSGVPPHTPRTFPNQEEAKRTRLTNRFYSTKQLKETTLTPLFLRQEHGTTVCHASQAFVETYDPHHPPVGDAWVTNETNILLGVKTADCGPLLWCDPTSGVIAATHAGWRGALAGVIEATHQAMLALGAQTEKLVVALGPTIAQKSYEVGQEFKEIFLEKSQACEMFFCQRANRTYFDLPAFIIHKLRHLGIPCVRHLPHDTYTTSHLFSCRHSKQQGQWYGSNEALIVRTPQKKGV